MHGHIAVPSRCKVEVFSAACGWVAWTPPKQATMIYIYALGSGGGGGAGQSGASGLKQGGGGAGSAACMAAIYPLALLPGVLYIYVAAGGLGGVAGNGGNGELSHVTIIPGTIDQNTWIVTSGRSVATGGVCVPNAGTGGDAQDVVLERSSWLSCLAISARAQHGQNGANGFSSTGGGVGHTLPNNTSGGCGGGGWWSGGAGGSYTNSYAWWQPNISGGTGGGPGQPGHDNLGMGVASHLLATGRPLFTFSGGTGGAGVDVGTGGDGGAGGHGSGGAGAGCGTTGGKGGQGGDGLVLIVTW